MSRTARRKTLPDMSRGTSASVGRARRPHSNGTTYEATLALHAAAWRMLAMRQAADRRQAETRLWTAARARGARRRAVICGHARALRAMGARHGRERLEVESRLWLAVLALGHDLAPRGRSGRENGRGAEV